MAFPSRLLNDDEHVVVHTREHPKALLLPLLVLVVGLAVGVVVQSSGSGTGGRVLHLVVWALVAVVVVWWVVRPLVTWATTTYTFTNRRMIKRSGFIAKAGRTIPLNRISGVDFEIGVVDRLFGCGTLVVSDASEQGRVELQDIPRVEEVQLKVADELHRLSERRGSDDGTEEPGREPGPQTGPGEPGARTRDPHALERAVLGAEPSLTAHEVADRTGVPVDQLRRLWWALGFPEHGTAVAFTEDDVGAVSRLDAMVASGAIDRDISVTMTRALGQSTARLADWEVAILAHRVEELERSEEATGSRTGQALRMLEELNPEFEELLRYAWRRHLAAALARIEALGAHAEDLHTTQVTVGFADIVGFTALSNELTRERIGDIVEIFESRCADVVAGQRGRIIKSLGDAVLFLSDDPVAAYDIAEGVIRVVGRDPRMPEVRVGLASGHVVTRLGDVFGPPVNLASRLTAVARRNRIIIDSATAELLPEDQFETRRLPARPVRGFGLVEPLTVRRH